MECVGQSSQHAVTFFSPQAAVDACDENTILVCSILGVTYTGAYEDTKAINDLLEKKNKAEGLDIHIHVDAASGGCARLE